MKSLITVVLAGATSLLTLDIAMASGRVFGSQGWLVPYLLTVSILLYLLAAALAFMHWREDRHKENVSPITPPPAINQVIKQEANPHIHNTVVIHKDSPIKPQRTAAEQNDYDNVVEVLRKFKRGGKDTARIALLYIRNHPTLRYGNYGGHGSSDPPPGLTPDDALWVYRQCASVGILNNEYNLGRTLETFTIPNHMRKILDEALFEGRE